MYLMQEILARITQQPLDVYGDELFYKPLGACAIGFRPLESLARGQIVPTEDDRYFRQQLLQGYVQEPGAAMAGGLANRPPHLNAIMGLGQTPPERKGAFA